MPTVVSTYSLVAGHWFAHANYDCLLNVRDSLARFWAAAAITASQDASDLQDHETVVFGCLR